MDRWRSLAQRERTLPGADVPLTLTREGPHGPVIHALNEVAQSRGIQLGDRVVDAQAIHPDLYVELADPAGDIAFLDRLALWSRRWCPWTVRDGDAGLILDVTGAAHLFGGEAAVLRDMRDRFAMQGLTARLAMAPTRGAAQALARYAAPLTLCHPRDIARDLAPLPVRALRMDSRTLRLLDRLGLRTIGALAEMPRAALMRRFAQAGADMNPLVLLDRTMGRLPEPLNAPPDPTHFLIRLALPEPVMDAAPHLPGLMQTLCADLVQAGRGARLLRLTIYRVDGVWRAAEVATATASREPAHLLRLLSGKLDGIDPGFGFDLLTLEARHVEPLALRQDRLDGARDSDADVSALMDRLTARLGRDKVTWSTWTESHVPERVETRAPALGRQPTAPPVINRDRPIRLLDRPEEVQVIYAVPEGPPARFRWRKAEHRTTRHEGPERIAPEWWKDRPGTRLRDYYKIEVEDGRRFWLYREGLPDDGRGGAPRWFLHGFFA
jgi:protein ImuB